MSMNAARRRGFSLIELLVVVSVIALLVSILLPSLAAARRSARTTVCMSNYHQFGVAFATYGNDNKERIATYSWRPGKHASPWTDLVPPITTLSGESTRISATYQAAAVLRQLTGDETIMPRRDGIYPWNPCAIYNHVVLIEYLGHRLPEPMSVCPEDGVMMDWFRRGLANRGAIKGDDPAVWNLYASTYVTTSSAYAEDNKKRLSSGGSSSWPTTVSPAANLGHDVYNGSGDMPWLTRELSEVRFPAQKVAMMDWIARHDAKPNYYAYDDLVSPVLFWDSSVRMVRAGESNYGTDPNSFSPTQQLKILYAPDTGFGDPLPRNGQETERIRARYEWTTGGLKGVDVGGAPLNPSKL